MTTLSARKYVLIILWNKYKYRQNNTDVFPFYCGNLIFVLMSKYGLTLFLLSLENHSIFIYTALCCYCFHWTILMCYEKNIKLAPSNIPFLTWKFNLKPPKFEFKTLIKQICVPELSVKFSQNEL